MATRRYKVSPGKNWDQVVEEVGAANNSDVVELTVDLGALVYGKGNVLGTISKEDVLIAIENLENWIIKNHWPPA